MNSAWSLKIRKLSFIKASSKGVAEEDSYPLLLLKKSLCECNTTK